MSVLKKDQFAARASGAVLQAIIGAGAAECQKSIRPKSIRISVRGRG